jgi:hypothetical protein
MARSFRGFSLLGVVGEAEKDLEHFRNTHRLYESSEGWLFLRKSHLSVCFRSTAIPKNLYPAFLTIG